MARTEIRAAVLLLACLLPAPLAAASRYDPALRFRVLSTPHFYVYFHQGEEATARRFASMAEQVHGDLTRRLLTAPRGRTHVILVDQNDRANGWATPLPYDTIEITVSPPASREVIGNTDDWLRLVFTHEYTHILHLDRSTGFAAVLRGVFGRAPLAFPNLFLPPWQTEGLATYEESATTGRGRVNAGDFALLVRQAARERRAWPLDRATSDFDDWPSGNTPYAYGAFFNQYLADRYGERKLADLASRTSGRFYYLSSRAFNAVYGKSLGTLWREYIEAHAALAPVGSTAAGRRLTRQGFVVTGPHFVEGPSGLRLLYSSRTSDEFPSLMSVDLEGHTRRLTTRYYGDQVSVAQGAVIYDQQDLARSIAIRSDLYQLDLASRRVERLTRGRRLLDPAVAPDGHAIAAVALRGGERTLVVFQLPVGAWPRDVRRLRAALAAPPSVIFEQPGAAFASPCWSPDGQWLAVARASAAGGSEIAVVEMSTRRIVTVAVNAVARHVTPAWTPDGRTLLFAADVGPGRRTLLFAADAGPGASSPVVPPPFNIFAADISRASNGEPRLSSVFQVTNLSTGAMYPAVAAAPGQEPLLAYVGYTAAGYDLFAVPFARTTWTAVPSGPTTTDQQPPTTDQQPPTTDQQPPTTDQQPTTNDHPYVPWRTVLPRYWMPALDLADNQVKIGAQSGGSDVLGRHRYSVNALVRVAGNAGAPGSRRYDWAGSYVYDRWVPAIFAAASDRTHFLRDVRTGDGRIVPADLREQNEELGVVVPDAHVRYSQAVSASLALQRQSINVGGLAAVSNDRNAIRLAWAFDSTNTYGYSIGPEQGALIGVTGELVRKGLGAVANADAVTVDARGYVRLGGRHAILAARGAVGAARGHENAARRFFLGGTGPNGSAASFGSDALNLLRGFSQNEFSGLRLAVVNVEYRLPLLRVERGVGTFPVFMRTLQAAVFVDAGKTWTRSFSEMGLAHGAGIELSGNFRLGYELPITVAAGVAWARDPAGGAVRGAATYARVGYGF